MKTFNIAATKSASLLNRAMNLASLVRLYSTRTFTPRSEIELEFQEASKAILKEFEEHEAIKGHPFFNYLEQKEEEGINSRQFEIFRANFFFRTNLTIVGLMKFALKAKHAEDLQTVSETMQNLGDETGHGNFMESHIKLLLDSYNQHGKRIFGLPTISSIKSVKHSENLVPEALDYARSKKKAFSRSYPYLAGNIWAHELAADDMLKRFKNAFFTPYEGHYSPDEYESLIKYFTLHSDESKADGNVEERHGQMAKDSAIRACKENLKNLSKVRDGGLEFLEAQSKLWDGMKRKMENVQNEGIAIPVKPRLKIQQEEASKSPIKETPQHEKTDIEEETAIEEYNESSSKSLKPGTRPEIPQGFGLNLLKNLLHEASNSVDKTTSETGYSIEEKPQHEEVATEEDNNSLSKSLEPGTSPGTPRGFALHPLGIGKGSGTVAGG
ncbi:MAG: hypothetical protein K0R25_220 [Rickettsiaceae bacterium]|jgi:hypothetical protein|nr:hypothetical protein [Rickettsiaceae bacterium]